MAYSEYQYHPYSGQFYSTVQSKSTELGQPQDITYERVKGPKASAKRAKTRGQVFGYNTKVKANNWAKRTPATKVIKPAAGVLYGGAMANAMNTAIKEEGANVTDSQRRTLAVGYGVTQYPAPALMWRQLEKNRPGRAQLAIYGVALGGTVATSLAEMALENHNEGKKITYNRFEHGKHQIVHRRVHGNHGKKLKY